MQFSHQIAGFLRQIYILLWKNGKLTLRNRSGTLIELFGPLVFLAVIIVVRYYVDKYDYGKQNNFLADVFDTMPIYIMRTRLVYYPPNQFIKTLIESHSKRTIVSS